MASLFMWSGEFPSMPHRPLSSSLHTVQIQINGITIFCGGSDEETTWYEIGTRGQLSC